ncbi:hypothetical protein OSB04_003337 [Centaurea solstitialis]|uniref:Serpin domain-containing protein n=1 Tax=Centaurea solstitialis TaxID=347529 RepID=A0AA38U543_9ASTR|nr:hypothetical protein OSB04_003337 [Centaurea solstitialis]
MSTKADEATKEVNSWAEKQTNGLIKDILPTDAVNEDTRLIFANAIYFKGTWTQKFDPSITKDYVFHLLNGTKIQAPFMTTENKQFLRSCDGFKVLALPYLQGQDKRRFTMYLYLPDAIDGLESLIQKIGSGSDFLDRHVPFQKEEVGRFLIPKFKISFAFEASKMLKELGLHLPFVGGLTGMVDCPMVGRKLFVSSIHHKSFVEVNEEGTEAAAVSGIVIEMQCLRNKVDFVADHPFLFVIREDTTGVVLFMGQRRRVRRAMGGHGLPVSLPPQYSEAIGDALNISKRKLFIGHKYVFARGLKTMRAGPASKGSNNIKEYVQPLLPTREIMGTQFSISLAKHLLYKSLGTSNVVFSPISIHAVLGVITAGSKGQTLDQLLSFLKTTTIDDLNALSSQLVSLVFADSIPSGGPRLSYANGLWVDQTLPLKPLFKQIVDGVYNATSNQVDFQTEAEKVVEQVNSWAEKQTNGLIKHILSANAINSTTNLIFANAVYFKGAWRQQFDPSQTKNYDFHLLNGTKVQTPFMTTKEFYQHMGIYHGFKVLGLPYLKGKDESRRFTMYLYLPNAKDGLPSLIKEMGSQSDFLDRHLPNDRLRVPRFLIPKFKIAFAFEASEMLKEQGVVLPFLASGGEGLSEMVEGGKVYVSSIHQKCVVEMNEQGTEAAAVTDCPIALYYDEVDFVADHPFMFVIREDTTGVVLFMGQVTDPLTLAKHLLSKSSQNSNVVFSPFSIHTVLGVIAAGAKGQTLNQLLSFLKTNTIHDLNALSSHLVSLVFADSSQSGGPRLSYANGLWVDQAFPLKPSFKQVVDGVYNATSNQVDFQTEKPVSS